MAKERDTYWDAVKGVAILLVVTIHYLGGRTGDSWTYLCRQFASISVFMFVFAAGYFTNVDRVIVETASFVSRRLLRLLLPYIVWSVATIMVFSPLDLMDFQRLFFHDLLLGYGVSIGYYVIALSQLALLTPFLLRCLKTRPCVAIACSAVLTLATCGVATLAASGKLTTFGLSVPVPYPGIFFTAWLWPYVLGLALRGNHMTLAHLTEKKIMCLPVCAGLFLLVVAQDSIMPMLGLQSQAQFNLSGQVFATACCISVVLFHRKLTGCWWLAVLGRGSFLIYLTHLKLFAVLRHVLPEWFGFRGGAMMLLPYVAGLGVVAIVYWCLIVAAEKVLPQNLRRIVAVS